MQIIGFILDKIRKFWRITRLSIISRFKVIWSQKQRFFGPPCIKCWL